MCQFEFLTVMLLSGGRIMSILSSVYLIKGFVGFLFGTCFIIFFRLRNVILREFIFVKSLFVLKLVKYQHFSFN